MTGLSSDWRLLSDWQCRFCEWQISPWSSRPWMRSARASKYHNRKMLYAPTKTSKQYVYRVAKLIYRISNFRTNSGDAAMIQIHKSHMWFIAVAGNSSHATLKMTISILTSCLRPLVRYHHRFLRAAISVSDAIILSTRKKLCL